MEKQSVKEHLLDILKGMVGAVATAACLAALNYLGAHLPDLIELLSPAGGAVAAIKMMRRA